LSCEAWPRSRRNGEDVVLAGNTLCGFVLCTMEVEGVVGEARNETTIEKGVCSFRVVSVNSRYHSLHKTDMDNFLAIFFFRFLGNRRYRYRV
jgi:hypothetical protein